MNNMELGVMSCYPQGVDRCKLRT